MDATESSLTPMPGCDLCVKHGLDPARVLTLGMDDEGYDAVVRRVGANPIIRHEPWPSDEAREDFRAYFAN